MRRWGDAHSVTPPAASLSESGVRENIGPAATT